MLSLVDVYPHRLEPESGLTGSVLFKPVISISPDFAAPVEMLEKSLKLAIAESYRAVLGGEHLCA